MTNGEKLEQVFPDGICPFSKSWLDYEYKEPLTKVNQDLTKNDDCISRQAINGYIDYILSHGMGKKKSFDFIKKFVANLPPATPIRPKGHWIWCFGSHKCSNCEEYTCFSDKELLRYCPNCGAKMEVEE